MLYIHKLIRQIVLEVDDGGLFHAIRGALERGIVALCYNVDRYLCTNFRLKYYKWRASRDIYNYENSPDPFKIIYIDPSNIEYMTGRDRPHLNRRLYFGKVMGGAWDMNCRKFKSNPLYIAAKKHFDHGESWKEIDEVQELIETVEQSRWGTKSFSNANEVFESLAEFDELYNSILKEGYIPQKELSIREGRTSSLYLQELDEVAVDIGRNGDLLHADGKHRLIVAKLLGIDSIPAVVHVRHKKWMEYRGSAAEQPHKEDHPDLRDL